jgi:hypothetical protein
MRIHLRRWAGDEQTHVSWFVNFDLHDLMHSPRFLPLCLPPQNSPLPKKNTLPNDLGQTTDISW